MNGIDLKQHKAVLMTLREAMVRKANQREAIWVAQSNELTGDGAARRGTGLRNPGSGSSRMGVCGRWMRHSNASRMANLGRASNARGRSLPNASRRCRGQRTACGVKNWTTADRRPEAAEPKLAA